jgi:hypothetical protein
VVFQDDNTSDVGSHIACKMSKEGYCCCGRQDIKLHTSMSFRRISSPCMNVVYAVSKFNAAREDLLHLD